MNNIKCIVIGGSAGSFSVVSEILNGLPKDFAFPVILCLHRLKTAKEGFAEALQLKSNLPVKEPYDKEKIKDGIVYLAPANYHMYVEFNRTFSLSTEEAHLFSRPAIDITLASTGYTYKKNLVGIMLSGANQDGALGMKNIKDYGGTTIIQDIKEAMVPTMPKAAKKVTQIDYELLTKEIIEFLCDLDQQKKASISRRA